MFERSKDSSNKNTSYPDPHPEAVEREAIELSEQRRFERKSKFRRRLALKLGAAALITSTITSAYWGNVQDNRVRQDAAEISLNVIAPAHDPANNDKMTVVFDGFNANDGNFLAGNMGPAIQQVADGEIVSIGYNNAILGRENMSETIVEYAHEHGKKEVSMVGYSMGGIISTEATADIVKNSSLPVNYLILISTPDGSDGVRPYQKGELDFMQWLKEWVPGAIDSSWFRFAGQVYFDRDKYTQGDFNFDPTNDIGLVIKNVGNFIDAIKDADALINNPQSTSMQLISQQAYKVDTFNMAQELSTISSQRSTKQLPVIAYLGTGQGGYDEVVNDKLSSSNFATDSKNANLFYKSFLVPDAVHSHYYDTPDQYMQTFNEASGPLSQDLKTEAGRHALNLFAQNFMKTQTTFVQAQK